MSVKLTSPVGGHEINETNLRKPRRSRSGHNLLEVIIASFIFSIVLIVMIGVWSLYYSAVSKSKNMLAATALARQAMESTLALSYNDIVVVPAGAPDPAPTPYSIKGQIRGRQFVTDFLVTIRCADSPWFPGQIKSVMVRVDWVEETGPKKVVYETRVTKT